MVSPVDRYLEALLTQSGSQTAEGAAQAAGGTWGIDPPAQTPTDRTWEWLLGGNWLARVGIVALILGVAFFISLAIDRGWLGETERVVLGMLFGLALLAAGEYYRTRYGVWAQAVGGGGLAILYLAVWGGFALYGLYPTLVAFGLFVLITVAGVVQSLRHDSVGLAVLAALSGFATPLLLQQRLPDERLLLAYILLLDLGVLALAGFRNWRWFTLLAWVGSLVLYVFWTSELNLSIALAQTGISAIFVIFVGATVAFHVVRRQPMGRIDLTLLAANAVFYLLLSYANMYDAYRPWMGGFTALLAVLYAILLAACWRRSETPLALPPFTAALMVGFAALAVPIQLDGAWITIAWGVEALALVWLSFRLPMRGLRWFAALVFTVSGVWLLALDTPDALSQDLPFFVNLPMLAYAAAVVLPALAAWLLHRQREALQTRERLAVPALAVAAALFATVAIPVQLSGIWVSVAWAAEAVILLALSAHLRLDALRWFAYLLLATMLVRLAAIDTDNLDLETFRPVINWRFLPFATGVASLYTALWLVRRHSPNFSHPGAVDEPRLAPPMLFGAATLTTIWILSAEVLASADSALFDLSYNASENVSILGLTLLWGVYGAGLMLLGVLRRWRWVRVVGLALLIASVVKLFAYDSQELEQVYRVIAFLVLGAILVAGGLLYQRHSHAVRGFLLDD